MRYLRDHVIGVYSGLLYAPAGEAVEIIRAEGEMVLVKNEALIFWTKDSNLTPIKPPTNEIPKLPERRDGKGKIIPYQRATE